MRIRTSRRRRERGSSFIEFGLVSLILIPLFFAVIDYSRVFYYASIAQGAARAGTQYAVFQAPNHANTSGITTAATADATSATNASSIQSFSATPTYWCQCSGGGGTVACTGSCTSPETMQVYSQVNTQLTFNTVFNYPLLPNSITVKGQSIMRVQ